MLACCLMTKEVSGIQTRVALYVPTCTCINLHLSAFKYSCIVYIEYQVTFCKIFKQFICLYVPAHTYMYLHEPIIPNCIRM